MSNNVLSMETLNELRLMSAWKQMSAEFAWNEEQLERYKNNVDWDLVSANENVAWSLSLLERFKNRLNWKVLSKNNSKHIFQAEIIRAFADFWDWSRLSAQDGWSLGMIEEFKDRIDWAELVNNGYLGDESFFNETFLIKYFDYIKFTNFENSFRGYSFSLWERLCKESYKKLSDEVSGLTRK